ncbi:MAG: ribonuclease J [Desulfatiglans sp.]|jgi:ribonuclease J|nr:ribonuclease J [Thermodesulfobacteriota bacterium]MEE4353688.1 ribonuclease J [Desulfatiglans sp.]
MLKIIPLGGLGEIGLNMMAIQFDQYLLVVDAGLMFPNDYMPGVDLVIPDFRYLKDNREVVKSLILTHGHEDHIGAIPFFLEEFPVPVFGTKFTLALLKEKLKEYDLPKPADLRVVEAGQIDDFGPFRVEFISVNHSIVDGVALAIDTPEGLIVHSGDFKIDPTPVDSQFTDLVRLAHFGAMGVVAFFSDSTNVEKEGFTMSEREVRKTLEELFRTSSGRVIVATFASSITRIQEVIDLAIESGRKVVLNGRSMVTNVEIAKEQGFINIPDGVEIDERQISRFADQEIAIITTGSQGEPMSALARMAQGKHKNISVKHGDTIILSSRFIPGNELAITSVINNLYRMGADVVYEKVSDIHTSGHARREELKLLLNLIRPQYFVPIHGEYRHLVKHAQLAMETGMPKDHVLLAEDGDVICLENGRAEIKDHVHTGRILVHGKGVGDVGEIVLRDRRRLGGQGVVIVLLVVDKDTGDIIYGPDIISRGFVYEDPTDSILDDAKLVVLEILDQLDGVTQDVWTEAKTEIERKLKRFFYNIIERRPLIIPVITPV